MHIKKSIVNGNEVFHGFTSALIYTIKNEAGPLLNTNGDELAILLPRLLQF
jgi:hypothetical protein